MAHIECVGTLQLACWACASTRQLPKAACAFALMYKLPNPPSLLTCLSTWAFITTPPSHATHCEGKGAVRVLDDALGHMPSVHVETALRVLLRRKLANLWGGVGQRGGNAMWEWVLHGFWRQCGVLWLTGWVGRAGHSSSKPLLAHPAPPLAPTLFPSWCTTITMPLRRQVLAQLMTASGE